MSESKDMGNEHFAHEMFHEAGSTLYNPAMATPQHGIHPRRANPDDPPVERPPYGPHGPLPGPSSLGAPGRIAIVQAQVLIVAVILIAQLWLITTALYEWLSGQPAHLGWLTLASGIGFLIALVVWWWPRRRVMGL
jgi:hypothetical protein